MLKLYGASTLKHFCFAWIKRIVLRIYFKFRHLSLHKLWNLHWKQKQRKTYKIFRRTNCIRGKKAAQRGESMKNIMHCESSISLSACFPLSFVLLRWKLSPANRPTCEAMQFLPDNFPSSCACRNNVCAQEAERSKTKCGKAAKGKKKYWCCATNFFINSLQSDGKCSRCVIAHIRPCTAHFPPTIFTLAIFSFGSVEQFHIYGKIYYYHYCCPGFGVLEARIERRRVNKRRDVQCGCAGAGETRAHSTRLPPVITCWCVSVGASFCDKLMNVRDMVGCRVGVAPP